MMLFNRPIRDLLPQMNRGPINRNNNGMHYVAFKPNKESMMKTNKLKKKPSVFITGATVIVQQEDLGPWTHGVIVKPNNCDHRGCTYIIWVMNTGRNIMQNLKHICGTTITSEDYL